ncbi:hypothetical protein SBI_07636 [Streptomyces bingchenggensis BCW-1]|uniref:Uncharacterized protein n=1 Tax=Streptomyces bingchenggensis (strain BCW-1) TaxID=749414 RepID=D7CB73_STRBB|nr:hypothetical protein SBI_07636 [Streptomyces bingchenggensis BCW-1]
MSKEEPTSPEYPLQFKIINIRVLKYSRVEPPSVQIFQGQNLSEMCR